MAKIMNELGFNFRKGFFEFLIQATFGAGMLILSAYMNWNPLKVMENILIGLLIILAVYVIIRIFTWKPSGNFFKDFTDIIPVIVFGFPFIILFILYRAYVTWFKNAGEGNRTIGELIHKYYNGRKKAK